MIIVAAASSLLYPVSLPDVGKDPTNKRTKSLMFPKCEYGKKTFIGLQLA